MSLGYLPRGRLLQKRAVGRFSRAQAAASKRRALRRRTLGCEALERREVLSGVVTIGDSWAWLIAAGAPGSAPAAPGFSNSLGTAISAFFPGVPVYNESFGGGTAAQHAAQIGDIINRINAHPDADIVWLSSGGNDLLLGTLGGGFYVNNPNNGAVFASIQSNVQFIVDSILAIRPDIQVVIASYDYINVWDMVTGSAGDTIRANLGIIKSGNVGLDGLQNQALNDGLKAAENGKVAIANASRRVAHVWNYGLLNTTNGYGGGYFPSVAGTGTVYPPELYPAWPTRPSLMNSGDAIHLNSSGYNIVSLYGVQQFFGTALQSGSLSLDDFDLAFGNVRIGTSASLNVTASNAGPNYTKVKNLAFSVATGPFSGGGQSFNPLFKDPSLGSDTATVSYTFTPTGSGTSNQIASATSTSNNQNTLLSGTGVGPVFNAVSSLSLSPVTAGTTVGQGFNVLNSTPNGDLGALTNMTLVSAGISGPDASRFSLPTFTPGTVISAGGMQNLALQFNAVGAASGSYHATLTFTTDVGAALGSAATPYSINVSATVFTPPVVSSGGPYNTTETASVSLNASGTGDITSYAWDLDNNGSYETSGQNVSFSKPDNGVFAVNVRATGPLGASTASTTVTVGNVAPTAGIVGPGALARGGSQSFTFSATDVSSVDQAAGFTYTIDWNGDGSDIQIVNGPSGTIVAHAFNTVGARTIKVTATDKDGGVSTQATQSATVSAVQVIGGDLVWTGTAGADHVRFEQLSPTSVRVTTTLDNGVATNFVETFGGVTGRLDAKGNEGDDTLDAAALASIAATLDGGTGNNTLFGGDANDILIGGANFGAQVNGPEGQQGNNIVVGGAGNDTIYGNAINGAEGRGGNNVLLGGAGNDTIYGNWVSGGEGGGRNILIGGADADTLYDYQSVDGAEGAGSILIGDDTTLSPAALAAIRDEWASAHIYTDRVNNILGVGGGGANGGNYLQAGTTVTADSAADTLWGSTGGTGFNWFWYVLAIDSINRAKAGETQSAI
ncbi:MAG: hypothetical protein K2Y37_23755 [Pirellulales bacterium]|nr:hypothetical protein [Pirellulales bacterium]